MIHSLLSKLSSRYQSQSLIVGFSYEAQNQPGRLQNAHAGLVIAGSDGPPWIVVDHEIESTIVARWPGRLWRVQIIKAASEQPNSSARYTRAVSVKVIEELPRSLLFGHHGTDVCRVLESAERLDAKDIGFLIDGVSQSALDAYSKAWNCWLTKQDNSSIHIGENHLGTLAIGGGSRRSPVGCAFTVLHTILRDRARTLVGDDAFLIDEDDTEYFSPIWNSVLNAFLCAAMGAGAPELVTSSEVMTLKSAWQNVYEKSA